MKQALGIIAILAIIAGGYYLYTHQGTAGPAMMQQDSSQNAQGDDTRPTGVSGAAGINGSLNQGNLGATSTGTVQQPGADGIQD